MEICSLKLNNQQVINFENGTDFMTTVNSEMAIIYKAYSINIAITESLHTMLLDCDNSIQNSKPNFKLVVAKKSEAKEKLASKFNKSLTYFREQSCIFKCCALMWSTLVHHTSRQG